MIKSLVVFYQDRSHLEIETLYLLFVQSGAIILKRLSNYIIAITDLLITAYYDYVYPFFVLLWRNIWRNAWTSNIIRLFRYQKRTVRFVFDLKFSQTCRSVFRNNYLSRSQFSVNYIHTRVSFTCEKGSSTVHSIQDTSVSIQFKNIEAHITKTIPLFLGSCVSAWKYLVEDSTVFMIC